MNTCHHDDRHPAGRHGPVWKSRGDCSASLVPTALGHRGALIFHESSPSWAAAAIRGSGVKRALTGKSRLPSFSTTSSSTTTTSSTRPTDSTGSPNCRTTWGECMQCDAQKHRSGVHDVLIVCSTLGGGTCLLDSMESSGSGTVLKIMDRKETRSRNRSVVQRRQRYRQLLKLCFQHA
jgi:hypothetical protein